MTSQEIPIIKLGPKDWELYKGIRLESLKMEPQAFNSKFSEVQAKPDEFWIEELSDINKLYLFAIVDNEIVGTMNASFNENGIKDEVVIHGAYVNIMHRRKGIARQLLSTLLEESKKRVGIKKAKLWVKGSQIKARKLYESAGFSVTGKDMENQLIMEKFLTANNCYTKS